MRRCMHYNIPEEREICIAFSGISPGYLLLNFHLHYSHIIPYLLN